MFCALCDQFIWKEGGTVSDRRVCQRCTKELMVQNGVIKNTDGDVADGIVEGIWDEVYEAVMQAATEAATDAIDKVRRQTRTKIAAA